MWANENQRIPFRHSSSFHQIIYFPHSHIENIKLATEIINIAQASFAAGESKLLLCKDVRSSRYKYEVNREHSQSLIHGTPNQRL